MASKRSISIRWRMFVPVVVTFWLVIICMAWWQLHRVSQLKKETVWEQLELISSRLSDIYNQNEDATAVSFVDFVNRYYNEAMDYDPMSIKVYRSDNTTKLNVGSLAAASFQPPSQDMARGIVSFPINKINGPETGKAEKGTIRYIYFMTRTHDGMAVCVFLPYTREVSRTLSVSTARFWFFILCIAIFATIFTYISTQYITVNVKLLSQFAHNAANDPDFIMARADNFPHDELGDISRQIVTIYNQRVHEMQRREQEHQMALHAVDEKNRIKRELTSNINHELKTPVGVIQGYIDTIVENPDMDAATRQRFLLKTQQNAHRLTALITDITAITRLESGGKLVNVSEVDFHELMFTFDNYLTESNLLQGKMLFTYEVPMHCMVLGNEALLQAVLTNFVKNAVAYSQGTMCRLETVKEDDDFYYFRFLDDGVGVPPEHLPHMFERFYRVNTGRSREHGGTGLGLSIVEVTIKSFGGDIDVQNHYPSGLEFNFSLPKYKKQQH